MNALPQHLFLHEVARRVADVRGHDDQSGCASNDLALRDDNAVSGGAIPNTRHPISCVLGHYGIDIEKRHAECGENIAVSHGCESPSLSNGTDDVTYASDRAWNLAAGGNFRFRAAPCVNSAHSTNLAAILNTSVFATFGSGERK